MKKIFSVFLTIAALCGVMSCNKSAPAKLDAPQPDGAITVRINAGDQTKATYMAGNTDKQINSIQVFVFDAENKLETDYFKSFATPQTGSTDVTIATFRGQKTVYAVLNHARITLAKEFPLASFEGEGSSVLTDLSENTYVNSPASSNLIMSGKNTIDVKEYNTNADAPAESVSTPQVLNIYVKRLASMVLLEKVTVNFTGTSLEGASFLIDQIYLRNAVGKCRLGMSGVSGSAGADVLPLALSNGIHNAAENWYNRGKYSVATGPAVTYENSMNLSAASVTGSPTSVGHCLLTYPNRSDGDSHDASFNPRHTRLVLKAVIMKAGVIDTEADGTCYYTFDLPQLNANNIYRVKNINITLFGSNTDDDINDEDPGRITPTITVDEWKDVVNLNYEF